MSDSNAIVPAPINKAKTWVQEFVERATNKIEHAPAAAPLSYVRTAGSVAMEMGEGATIGALLGAAHAKWGLDGEGGPKDGLISLLLGLGAIATSGLSPEFSEYAARGSGQAAAVFAFRKSYNIVSGKPLAAPSSPGPIHVIPAQSSGGTTAVAGEDPIEAVARKLA